MTGETKGIGDACVSERLRHGGKPVDVCPAVIALLENVTPFDSSILSLVLIH